MSVKKSREMTVRRERAKHCLGAGGEKGVKTTEKKQKTSALQRKHPSFQNQGCGSGSSFSL
jgi:hypothetical protein